MSRQLHQAPRESLDPEKVAYWYFRLNGFLQIENFVVHPERRGGQRTDADLLAVRFPHRAERLFDYPYDVMPDDGAALALSEDLIEVVIAEVKTNQPCTLNGPWTQYDRQNVHRVLAAIGCLPRDCINDAAADIYRAGVHKSDIGFRIRLVAVGQERSIELAEKYPEVTQLIWTELLTFVWERFKKYRQQKTQVDQWDVEGQKMKRLADQSRDVAAFIEEALRQMGVRSTNNEPNFARYIGIDYSGANTPNKSLKGLRVYLAEDDGPPTEVLPPPSPRKYWTRKGVAHWLVERLSEDVPTLVGIDHGFSFPMRYFETHGLVPNWPNFLDDFQRHWPTNENNTYVDFVRNGSAGNGAARMGNARWRRLTEERAGGAKSVFHFDVPGSVAKSTHSGIPWLRFIRQELGEQVHFWPFDGWDIPEGRSVMAEVYPALWSGGFASEDRTADQHDAYSIAAWLSRADRDGSLAEFLQPALAPSECPLAQVEGWILGVM
jgi:hypothetical protein